MRAPPTRRRPTATGGHATFVHQLPSEILGECGGTCFRGGGPGCIDSRIDCCSLFGSVAGRLIENLLEVVASLLGFARPGLQLAGQHASDCQPTSDRLQSRLRIRAQCVDEIVPVCAGTLHGVEPIYFAQRPGGAVQVRRCILNNVFWCQTLMVAATQHPPRSMKVGLADAKGECCVAATVK